MLQRAAFTEGQNVRALRSNGWLYLLRGDGRLRLAGWHAGCASTRSSTI